MPRFTRAFASVAIVLLASSVAGNGLTAILESARAMACCAKAKHQCAGVRSEDQCCRGMGHSLGAAAPATVQPSTHVPALSVAAAVPAAGGTPAAHLLVAHPSLDLARPHDPPHLHAFTLRV